MSATSDSLDGAHELAEHAALVRAAASARPEGAIAILVTAHTPHGAKLVTPIVERRAERARTACPLDAGDPVALADVLSPPFPRVLMTTVAELVDAIPNAARGQHVGYALIPRADGAVPVLVVARNATTFHVLKG